MGLGHLARSTALGQALQLRGVEVEPIAVGSDSDLELDGLRWSAGSAARGEGADLALLDGYELDSGLPERIGARRSFWMHPPPDGGAEAPDLVLELSGTASADRLAGLPYACLRRDYWSRPERRDAADQVHRALVTIGGSDAGGPVGELADSVAAALPDASVAMVRGPQSDSGLPPGVELLEAPASLAPLLGAADLVVSAGGQTMLEALCCGAPTVVVVRADNQRAQVRLIEAAAAADVCADESELAPRVAALASSVARRRKLGERGQRAVDGLGAHRVADQILARLCGREEFGLGGLQLRDAAASDSDFLLELRNDPSAYRHYRNPNPASAAEHAEWLPATLADPASSLLVIEHEGLPVGSLRLHPSAAAGEGLELGVSLIASARGRGLGRRAIEAAVAYAFVRRGVGSVSAAVRPQNEASLTSFGAAGFDAVAEDAEGFRILRVGRPRFGWGGSPGGDDG